jgi:hypothetical protein
MTNIVFNFSTRCFIFMGKSVTVSPSGSFTRLKLTFGWWGLILIIGGFINILYEATDDRNNAAMLGIWLGLSVVGIIGMYLLSPRCLDSGSLFTWGLLIVLGLGVSWAVLFPLAVDDGYEYLSTLWHILFAGGYLLTGYFMDRRFWWIAAWETLVALFMLSTVFINPLYEATEHYLNLIFGLTSGIPLLVAALPIWQEKLLPYNKS